MNESQRILVQSHISALEAEAAAERLGLAARANHRRKPSIRAALGRGLIAAGAALTAAPALDEPCRDTEGHPA